MLSVKSEASALQKCRVQARTGHFAVCTQQTTSTSVSSDCVLMSDDRRCWGLSSFTLTLLLSESVHPALRNQWEYLQGKAQVSGETLIMFHDLVIAL